MRNAQADLRTLRAPWVVRCCEAPDPSSVERELRCNRMALTPENLELACAFVEFVGNDEAPGHWSDFRGDPVLLDALEAREGEVCGVRRSPVTWSTTERPVASVNDCAAEAASAVFVKWRRLSRRFRLVGDGRLFGSCRAGRQSNVV